MPHEQLPGQLAAGERGGHGDLGAPVRVEGGRGNAAGPLARAGTRGGRYGRVGERVGQIEAGVAAVGGLGAVRGGLGLARVGGGRVGHHCGGRQAGRERGRAQDLARGVDEVTVKRLHSTAIPPRRPTRYTAGRAVDIHCLSGIRIRLAAALVDVTHHSSRLHRVLTAERTKDLSPRRNHPNTRRFDRSWLASARHRT